MNEDQSQLGISLGAGDASPLELEELAAAVRRELLRLDVDAVEPVPAGPAPDGTRGVDLVAVGTMIVTLARGTPVLGQVVEVIRAWAARSPDRTVKLTLDGDTLELGGLSERDQHEVIRDWIARHPIAPAPPEPAT